MKKQETAVEWLIQELKEQIRKSAHNELDTKRTGDYRIGLTKAIEFCEKAKEMEKEQQGYSEDDLINAYRWGTTVNHGTKEHFNKLFEQFKKK